MNHWTRRHGELKRVLESFTEFHRQFLKINAHSRWRGRVRPKDAGMPQCRMPWPEDVLASLENGMISPGYHCGMSVCSAILMCTHTLPPNGETNRSEGDVDLARWRSVLQLDRRVRRFGASRTSAFAYTDERVLCIRDAYSVDPLSLPPEKEDGYSVQCAQCIYARLCVRLGLRSHCRTARPQCLPHWKSGHSTICLTSAQRFRRVPSTLTKCIRHPFSHFFLLSHSLYSPLCSPCSPHLHIYSSSLQRSNLRRTPGIRTSGLRISGPRMLSR